MSEQDRDLTGLFVRDIDQIQLPARASWRPAPVPPPRVSWSIFRPLAVVFGTAAVLVAALLIGVELRERGTPTASPTPSLPAAAVTSGPAPTPAATGTAVATPGSPSPSATASPRTEVLDANFGVLWGGPNQGIATVRRETGEEPVATVDIKDGAFNSGGPVSPDGRFVAYWSPWSAGAVLHVAPVSGGDARRVLTAPDDLSSGAFAWSTDGTGLVAEVERVRWFGPPGGPPSVAQMWTIDLASGATEKIAERTDGAIWAPIAWDRARGIVAAGVVTGDGGFMSRYDLVDLSQQPYTVRTTPIEPLTLAMSLRASSDAKYVLAIADGFEDIVWWPLTEPERREVLEGSAGAAWRPGTSEIWWVGGLTGAGCPAHPCVGTDLVRFDVATGTRSVVHRGEYRSAIFGFRVDGSAAITAAGDPNAQFTPSGNRMNLTFVDLATGGTASFSVDGVLIGAVRLSDAP